jgi:hypothetical protein
VTRIAPLLMAGHLGCADGSAPIARPPETAHPPAATPAPTTPAAKAGMTSADIDAAIRAEWSKNGITPSPPVDDARFLRRAYLDIVGVVPPPDRVRAFLTDTSPDKRAKTIDVLLASPRYSEHWAAYWEDELLGPPVPKPTIDRAAFHDWVKGEIARGAGYDRFVYDLLTASGQNTKPAGDEAEPVDDAGAASDAGPNGAVNWLLQYAQTPEDLSGSASKIFLGVQIQCAQCHDHKTEPWKQTDFQSFTACFSKTRAFPIEKVKGALRRVEVRDVDRAVGAMRGAKKMMGGSPYVTATPAALDGTDFSTRPNRRQALAAWMTAPENPWFSRAIVNRMWDHFLGDAFVEPIDDFRASNPPIMADLLTAMGADFAAHGYDLKRLIRLISGTEVYQLTSAPRAREAKPDTPPLWSHYPLKALGPDELLDSLVAATNLGPVLERVAGDDIDQLKADLRRRMTFLFDVDEDADDSRFEGTIQQALMLLNGRLTNGGASAIVGAALADILAAPGDDKDKIETLYLRTLSRRPSASELDRFVAYVNAPNDLVRDANAPPDAAKGTNQVGPKGKNRGAGKADSALGRLAPKRATPKQQAYEDLFWALLNSSEFYFNH